MRTGQTSFLDDYKKDLSTEQLPLSYLTNLSQQNTLQSFKNSQLNPTARYLIMSSNNSAKGYNVTSSGTNSQVNRLYHTALRAIS